MTEVDYRALAAFAYDADNEAEISLDAGMTYQVTEINDSGWWYVTSSGGVSGWAPSNYLKRMDEEEDLQEQPEQPEQPEPQTPVSPEPSSDEVQSALNNLQEMQATKTCHRCKKEVVDAFVMAKKNHFHIDCFNCANCSVSLAGETYVEKDGQFYCENCFHNNFSPKCARCNEVIKGQYISALDQHWHPDHFVCTECGSEFESDRFRKRNKKPYCENCFAKNFSSNCEACGKVIAGKVFNANGKNFHEDCFVCAEDGVRIPESDPFHVKDSKIYCHDHYKEKYIKVCQRCGKDVTGKYITVLDKYFHEPCWTCSQCGTSLSDGEFKKHGEDFACNNCAPSAASGGQANRGQQGNGGYKADVAPSKTASRPVSKPADKGLPPGMDYIVGEDNAPKKKEKKKGILPVQGVYTYEELKTPEVLPEDIDRGRLEAYMSDSDFKTVLKMSRADFASLAMWKQKQIKKKAGLF